MNAKLLSLILLGATALTGCALFDDEGMFRNRSGDYRHAEEIPPLVVPEGMDAQTVGQLYPIPPISETAILEEFDVAPRPQPLAENSLDEVIKIQSLSGERWILSNRGPSEIWPRLRNILNRSGIPTASADASKGVLETVWLELKDDEGNNHRYRFYIRPGVQVDSTEIKVLHDQVSKEERSKEPWPGTSSDDNREKDMVSMIANALAGDISSGAVSLLAQSIGGEQQVEFVVPQVADPYLLMKLDYNRAWASVNYSVARGGFTLIDQDQSAGVFYVNYTPLDEDDGGWFSGLFKKDGGDKKTLEINCLVIMTSSDDGVQVRISDKDKGSLERKEAIKRLKIVRTNLS